MRSWDEAVGVISGSDAEVLLLMTGEVGVGRIGVRGKIRRSDVVLSVSQIAID
jgi:hypothetical protein